MNEKAKEYFTKNNINNLDRLDFNCGGFALGTLDWYIPREGGESEWFGDIYEAYEEEEISETECCDRMADKCVSYMLEDGRLNIREITSCKELQPNESLVIFRCAVDDFHFARYFGNGEWYHKQGVGSIKKVGWKQILSNSWGSASIWTTKWDNYRGRTRLLAIID